MIQKKTGSLLGKLMAQRHVDVEPELPPAAPVPIAAAPVRERILPVLPELSPVAERPIRIPDTAPAAGSTELPKLKKSYAIKNAHVAAVERLAWLWNISASQVVDRALEEFMATRQNELTAASELRSTADRRSAV